MIRVANAARAFFAEVYREIMATMERNDYHRWLEAQYNTIRVEHNLMLLHAGEIDSQTSFLGFVQSGNPLGMDFNIDLGQWLIGTPFRSRFYVV
jgi:hypothetical protein